MYFEITVERVCSMFCDAENQTIRIWSEDCNSIDGIIWEGNARDAMYGKYADRIVTSIDNVKLGTNFVTLNIKGE